MDLNDKLTIEKATLSDAEAIRSVQRKTWLATYLNAAIGITEQYVANRLDGVHGELIEPRLERLRKAISGETSGSAVYVARAGGILAGYVAPTLIGGQKHVGALYVLPEFQGKSIGTGLMQKVVEWHGAADNIFVHVARDNAPAIRFYKRFGFVATEIEIIDDGARNAGIPEIPSVEMVLKRR